MVGVEKQLCRQLPDPEQQDVVKELTFLIVSLSLLITKYSDAMVDVKNWQ